MWKVPEQFRVTGVLKALASKPGDKFGVFFAPSPDKSRVTKTVLYIIADDGRDKMEATGWEHVSLRAVKQLGVKQFRDYVPTWEEMCYAKSLFWDDEDVVMQLHPKKSEYINNHEFVLHLWRPKGIEIPTPPTVLIGVK